jgi:hypothetical protein
MPESSPSMKAPAHLLTSGRLKTPASRPFSADNSCAHPSVDPDHTATDMPFNSPQPAAENRALNRFATVVLERFPYGCPYLELAK